MSKPGKPEVRPSASSAEIAKRKEARTFAIANTTIEGGTVLPETQRCSNVGRTGEITDDGLLNESRRRHGPGAPP